MSVEDFTPPDDIPEHDGPLYDSTADDRVNDFDDPGDTNAEPVKLISDEDAETFFLDSGGER